MDSVELRRFSSASAYNAAYPRCRMPIDPYKWHRLRGYHLAMQGLADDLTGAGDSMTVDFLPGGPPLPGTPDRFGTVVASRWRRDSFLVLAEQVSLRDRGTPHCSTGGASGSGMSPSGVLAEVGWRGVG